MEGHLSLEQRVTRLEDIHAIKRLKYNYWKACDAKNPASVLQCFSSKEVHIDYEDFGLFRSAQDMVDKYVTFACHPYLIEVHHGKNEIITLNSSGADGLWSMNYSLVDEQNDLVINLNGIYQDKYIQESSRWVIKESIFTKKQTFKVKNINQVLVQAKADRSLGFK
jgi:hypothetical protein